MKRMSNYSKIAKNKKLKKLINNRQQVIKLLNRNMSLKKNHLNYK